MRDNRCPRCNGHGSYGWKLCRLCNGMGEEETREMSQMLVLFGAGSAGRYALKHLRSQGIEPLCFADNDRAKIGTFIDGVMVTTPAQAEDEWASREPLWVATAISRPAATEIRAQIASMGVKTKPLWECIPVYHGLPPRRARDVIAAMAGDIETILTVNDQCIFRRNPDYDEQVSPSPKEELYFPDFITHLSNEHFVDCGAADGDTVKEFIRRWPVFEGITAFEPDRDNYGKLLELRLSGDDNILPINAAISDFSGELEFLETGDYSAHIGTSGTWVECCKLDTVIFSTPPTYIKMDIEGAEIEAILGARKLLKDHKPVLAICAYHTSDHLWQIPLLIHAIQPDYKLFLRRYAEGAFELVWYAVPTERIIA